MEHDVLFCRELIAFHLYQYKSGSQERVQYLDRISENLNSIANPYLKVDQRALRDRIEKLLKHVQKRNKEEKASGIDVEPTEIDDLLLDIFERQKKQKKMLKKPLILKTKNLIRRSLLLKKLDVFRWKDCQRPRRDKLMMRVMIVHQNLKNQEVLVVTLWHISGISLRKISV